MSARGQAELASVMRKLLASSEFIAVDGHHGTFTIDDTKVEITEGEQQAIEEASVTPPVSAAGQPEPNLPPYMLANTREEFERVRDLAGRRLSEEAARIADRRQDERAACVMCTHGAIRHYRADWGDAGCNDCNCPGYEPDAVTSPMQQQDRQACRCDGGSYETHEHPFLVHPDCPVHAAVSPVPGQQREAVARWLWDWLNAAGGLFRADEFAFFQAKADQLLTLLAATRDGEQA